MKISERLAFLKAGYSKDEINKMIEEDTQAPAEENKETNTSPQIEQLMTVISSLADEVKTMKKAIQTKNIQDTSIPSGNENDIDRILSSLINPETTNTKGDK